MVWMLDHREDAKIMARCGQERMVAYYNLGHILELHETLYTKAMKK